MATTVVVPPGARYRSDSNPAATHHIRERKRVDEQKREKGGSWPTTATTPWCTQLGTTANPVKRKRERSSESESGVPGSRARVFETLIPTPPRPSPLTVEAIPATTRVAAVATQQ